MKTRDRIIATAIRLFNEKGTGAVSTNHIAAAAEISPGNLYYHFSNKADIIRAIFEQMDAYALEQYRGISGRFAPGSIEALEATFAMIQEFNWRYRFFKRELTSLVMTDPVLRERFQRSHHTLLGLIRQANAGAVAKGILKPLPAPELDLLAETIWLLALFWLNYLEVGGEAVDEQSLRRGMDLLRNVIRPHLTEAALAQMAARDGTSGGAA